jgi:hypothetical protein
MNRGTVSMVVIALASLAGAFAMAPRELPPPTFEDTGEPLFSDFSDPTIATSLEVVTWNEDAAKVVPFKVEQKEGRWVIPSHHDYPAEATERMGKAAASFIDVKRDVYYGDNAEEHAAFGLLDPTDPAGKGEEKGKRFTIKDASGTVLVDIIVGKEIEDKQGFRYVRFPDSKRVYGSKLELDISTLFTDWIEKDLLLIERDDVVALIYDPYEVDEEKGKVVNTRPIRVDLVDEDGKKEWTWTEGLKAPAGKELNPSTVRQMVGAIDRLQITGVRPRPQLLTLPALQSKGFFVTQGGRKLFGNEGEVRVICNDGVVYLLYFGEVTFDSGLALTAGTEEEAEDAGTGEDEGTGAEREENDDKAEGNRYMFVDVVYEPELDRSSETAAESAPDDETGNENEEEQEEDEGPRGPERAEMLRKRFDQWFYVISAHSFKQIHKDRDDLWREKKEKK